MFTCNLQKVNFSHACPSLRYSKTKTREPFNVNALAQVAATAALTDSEFIVRSIENNEQGKKYLYAELTKLGLKFYQTETNFIFVYVNRDCNEVFEKMMELGVTIRPMGSFGVKDAIRVTIGTQEQNERFIACLKQTLKL